MLNSQLHASRRITWYLTLDKVKTCFAFVNNSHFNYAAMMWMLFEKYFTQKWKKYITKHLNSFSIVMSPNDEIILNNKLSSHQK